MKATRIGEGVYRIGDEHGDIIDETGHPSRMWASPSIKSSSAKRREQRKRKKAR